MKVSLLSENLQKKLLFANHAVSIRGQLPILLNFLIEAKNGNLTIKSTDLEIGISVNIPAKIEEDGEITVPAKTFSELINSIPSGKITLTLRKEGLELIGDKIKTSFQTMPAEDFPKLYEDIGEEIITLKNEMVGKELPKIVFSASSDSAKPALSGVLVKEKQGKIMMVATDGYRLSLKAYGAEETKKERELSLIVPSRVIKELILMSKDNTDIKIYASKQSNQIIFMQNDTILVGRLIEADFPDYEKIIPSSFLIKTAFDREEMQKAIKTSYVFARESANIIKMSIKEDRVIVSSSSPSVGQNSVEVDAKTAGGDGEIAFNGRYLLDFFSNISEETVSLEMTGSLSPGVFKIGNDSTFLHLIMPIRVQGES